MNIAILIFLIMNFLLVGLVCACLVSVVHSDKTKKVKENHILSYQLNQKGVENDKLQAEYKALQERKPQHSKFKIGARVYCIKKNFVYTGVIDSIKFLSDNTIQYEISTDIAKVTALEHQIFLGTPPVEEK